MGVAENRATEMDIVFYREHVGNTMISHWISGVTHVFSQFGDLPHAQLVGLDGQESLSGQFEPVLLIVRLPQHPKTSNNQRPPRCPSRRSHPFGTNDHSMGFGRGKV